MNDIRYGIVFVGSLYALFFYVAVWFALPSSLTVQTDAIPSVAEQCMRLTGCEPTGSSEGPEAPLDQRQDSREWLAGARSHSCSDTWKPSVYQRSLITGASYN